MAPCRGSDTNASHIGEEFRLLLLPKVAEALIAPSLSLLRGGLLPPLDPYIQVLLSVGTDHLLSPNLATFKLKLTDFYSALFYEQVNSTHPTK
jgi:hypothetical protein